MRLNKISGIVTALGTVKQQRTVPGTPFQDVDYPASPGAGTPVRLPDGTPMGIRLTEGKWIVFGQAALWSRTDGAPTGVYLMLSGTDVAPTPEDDSWDGWIDIGSFAVADTLPDADQQWAPQVFGVVVVEPDAELWLRMHFGTETDAQSVQCRRQNEWDCTLTAMQMR